MWKQTTVHLFQKKFVNEKQTNENQEHSFIRVGYKKKKNYYKHNLPKNKSIVKLSYKLITISFVFVNQEVAQHQKVSSKTLMPDNL